MKHGTYIGEDKQLKGKTALIQEDHLSSTRGVLAQFDALFLPRNYTHGWTSFYSYEFLLDKEDEE